jgi:hypothetical protein
VAGSGVSLASIATVSLAVGSAQGSDQTVFAGFLLFGLGMGLSDVALNISAGAIEAATDTHVLPVLHGSFSLGTALRAIAGIGSAAAALPVAAGHGSRLWTTSPPTGGTTIRRTASRIRGTCTYSRIASRWAVWNSTIRSVLAITVWVRRSILTHWKPSSLRCRTSTEEDVNLSVDGVCHRRIWLRSGGR